MVCGGGSPPLAWTGCIRPSLGGEWGAEPVLRSDSQKMLCSKADASHSNWPDGHPHSGREAGSCRHGGREELPCRPQARVGRSVGWYRRLRDDDVEILRGTRLVRLRAAVPRSCRPASKSRLGPSHCWSRSNLYGTRVPAGVCMAGAAWCKQACDCIGSRPKPHARTRTRKFTKRCATAHRRRPQRAHGWPSIITRCAGRTSRCTQTRARTPRPPGSREASSPPRAPGGSRACGSPTWPPGAG